MDKIKGQPENGRMRRDQLLTIDDLETFKQELFVELRRMFGGNKGQESKRWLKSLEVRKLLNVSPNTLLRLRNTGTIPYTRIGGVIYYDIEDIQKIMSKKVNAL